VGLRLLRAARSHALLTDRPIAWTVDRPQRRHLAGSVVFGTGWAIAGACPGPIATQLGQGIGWSLFTTAGLLAGIALYLRRQAVIATPRDRPPRARRPRRGSRAPDGPRGREARGTPAA
jgi:uncharacterized membrane protein YedE/YeeE